MGVKCALTGSLLGDLSDLSLQVFFLLESRFLLIEDFCLTSLSSELIKGRKEIEVLAFFYEGECRVITLASSYNKKEF